MVPAGTVLVVVATIRRPIRRTAEFESPHRRIAEGVTETCEPSRLLHGIDADRARDFFVARTLLRASAGKQPLAATN